MAFAGIVECPKTTPIIWMIKIVEVDSAFVSKKGTRQRNGI